VFAFAPALFAQQQLSTDNPKLIPFCACNLAVSALFAAIPYTVGRRREQELLGYVGVGCTLVGGFLLTFIAAFVIAIIFVVLIYVFTSIPTDLGLSSDGPRRPRRPKLKGARRDDFAEEEERKRREEREWDDLPVTRLPELDSLSGSRRRPRDD
jgi:hypothetical protein